MEQITIFDLMEQRSDFPCDDCVFDKCNCCSHIENEECYCIRGSFQIKHSQVICPECGREMEVRQNDFDSDFAVCRCGLNKIFNNRGNRPSALELFLQGRLVGQ